MTDLIESANTIGRSAATTLAFLAEYTNTHQGAITALATIVIAVTGVVTAWLTRTLARENRMLRKAGTEPEVVVFLRQDAHFINIINFVLANIGKGPAFNVRFTFDHDEAEFASHNVRLGNNEHREAISVLPQDEQVRAWFGMAYELLREPRLSPFKVKVEYDNVNQVRMSKTSQLDVAQFIGLTRLGTPPEYEVAEALKKLAEKADQWTSYGMRLKVEVATTEELERSRDREELRRLREDELERLTEERLKAAHEQGAGRDDGSG